MNVERYVSALRDSLLASGRAAGAETAEAAERLSLALEPSMRLVMLQVLSDAADEITVQLGADPAVEVRLRGADPELVVVHPPRRAEMEEEGQGWSAGAVPEPPAPPEPPTAPGSSWGAEDGSATRFTLRIPAQLKAQVDDAAAAEGVSLNTWLVRAAQTALAPGAPARPVRSGKRLTGWAN